MGTFLGLLSSPRRALDLAESRGDFANWKGCRAGMKKELSRGSRSYDTSRRTQFFVRVSSVLSHSLGLLAEFGPGLLQRHGVAVEVAGDHGGTCGRAINVVV